MVAEPHQPAYIPNRKTEIKRRPLWKGHMALLELYYLAKLAKYVTFHILHPALACGLWRLARSCCAQSHVTAPFSCRASLSACCGNIAYMSCHPTFPDSGLPYCALCTPRDLLAFASWAASAASHRVLCHLIPYRRALLNHCLGFLFFF